MPHGDDDAWITLAKGVNIGWELAILVPGTQELGVHVRPDR
jgi:hypothetical protein